MNIVEITNGVPRVGKPFFREAVNLNIAHGEQLAIMGANASGKGMLVSMITGEEPLKGEGIKYFFGQDASPWVSDNIKHIAFRDSYGAGDKNYYHQQRWNSMDRDSQPLVKDSLPKSNDTELKNQLFELFNIGPMLEKQLILLSSGELRKLQLTKALLGAPKILVLENPFIGLDAATRTQLQDLLKLLTTQTSLQVILVLSKTDELPEFITHVVEIKNRVCLPKLSREDFLAKEHEIYESVLPQQKQKQIFDLSENDTRAKDSQRIIKINNITIRYGEYVILKDLSWRINRGEKWALSGENGAGKSTLLSLVCADNPQGYACDITLFGLRRGVDASIWDIKAHIGYVSPEMHRSYLVSAPCIEIVASGLHDTVGLYKRMKDEDVKVCEFWMDMFGILELKDRDFMRISSGEQRLVLLARAFVKDPELLILDEPLHGLDMRNRRLALDVIEAFCKRKNKTLILVTHYKQELPNCITDSFHLLKNR